MIYNGIDLEEYRKVETTGALERFGIDPNQPFVLFVGRITRQKGIIHLVRAIEYMAPGLQIVLCAGAPDTPEIGREMEEAVQRAQEKHGSVIWIREMVRQADRDRTLLARGGLLLSVDLRAVRHHQSGSDGV